MENIGTANILVVDDDRDIVEAVSIFLTQEGYHVFKAYDGLAALDVVASEEVHLILLDIMMPRMDGIQATLRLREQKSIPIILVSAKSEDSDIILGLNIGADDYITKPFNPLELVARVKSNLRRYLTLGSAAPPANQVRIGGLCLDTESRTVTVDGEPVRLTATEYGILELLMRNPGRVFSISEIYERVWHEESFNVDNTIAVHIRRIREKIEINPKEPRYLKVVWGFGYKIERQ